MNAYTGLNNKFDIPKNQPPERPSLQMATVRTLTCLGVVASFYFASVVLIPIVFSFFVFLLLDPIVEWAEKNKKISRGITAPALLLLTALAITGVGWGTYGAISKISKDIPNYSVKIRTAMKSFQGKAVFLQSGILLPKAAKDEIQKVEIVDSIGGTWEHALLRGLDSIVAIVTSLFLIPILALFFLLEKPHLKVAINHALKDIFSLDYIGKELIRMVHAFFLGNFIVGIGMSAIFLIIFKIMHLDNSLSLAFAAGFINLMPVIGSLVGAVLPMAQALLQFDTLGPAFIVFASSIVVHFIISNLVIPKVIGASINVNATFATIGIIFWGWLWGGLGLILAVPLTAMIRILLAAKKSSKPWANLLAEAPRKPVPQFLLPHRKKG